MGSADCTISAEAMLYTLRMALSAPGCCLAVLLRLMCPH